MSEASSLCFSELKVYSSYQKIEAVWPFIKLGDNQPECINLFDLPKMQSLWWFLQKWNNSLRGFEISFHFIFGGECE